VLLNTDQYAEEIEGADDHSDFEILDVDPNAPK